MSILRLIARLFVLDFCFLLRYFIIVVIFFWYEPLIKVPWEKEETRVFLVIFSHKIGCFSIDIETLYCEAMPCLAIWVTRTFQLTSVWRNRWNRLFDHVFLFYHCDLTLVSRRQPASLAVSILTVQSVFINCFLFFFRFFRSEIIIEKDSVFFISHFCVWFFVSF